MTKRPSIIGGLSLAASKEPAPATAPAEEPKPAGRRPRPEIVHTSVYLPRAVHKRLRAIAFETDRKVHDIIMEGIDAALQRYGAPSIEKLKKGG